MASPSYTEDLTDIATGDESSGDPWVEFAGNSFDDQGVPVYQDGDYPFIQGSYAITQSCSKSKTLGSLGYDYASEITLPTDGAFLVWQNFSSPFSIDDYVGTITGNAGMMVLVGDDVDNFDVYYVGGSDKTPNPYGGWQCHAVNTTITADDETNGTKTIDQVVGAAVSLIAYPSKGNPHQVDIMRFGRCSAIFEFGETADYATILGFVIENDNQSNRWGLLQETGGGYLWQGRMQFGSASNAVDFRDSNRTIFIKWTPKVTANFNLIEILNASSNIEMTGFVFQVLDISTASNGRLLMTDDADVAIDNCTFIDMDSFVFSVSTNTVTINGTVFRRCGLVTQGGADIDNCIFDEATGAVALLVDNPDNIDNCTFNSDGTGHAIELTADCAGNSYTLVDFFVNGYVASGESSTGNEAIFNDSGGEVTINIDGGSGVSNISVMNGSGASTILVADYSFTVTGLELNTEVTIVTADTSSVLHHTENATTSDGEGKYQITYSHSGGASVDVLIHHVDYLPDISNIYGLSLPSANSSAKVSMFDDLNYENP